MVALGFGKFARADRIFALERITGEERGDGRRTRVWIDGVADPLTASRTEITILRDMGQESVVAAPEFDEAMDLAARLAAAAEEGRVDSERPGSSSATPSRHDNVVVIGSRGLRQPAACLRDYRLAAICAHAPGGLPRPLIGMSVRRDVVRTATSGARLV